MSVPNPANLLAIAGLVGLGAMFYLPFGTGQRVARVEQRAAEVTFELLRTGLELAPIDLESAADRERVLERLRERCHTRGHPDTDLPETIDGAPGMVFGNRHYLFQLVRTPPPTRLPANWDPAARRPLEAHGWPRRLLPPGRTMFYVPEEGRAAYTRNLGDGHAGLEDPPPPGVATPRQSLAELADEPAYRARSDERWLFYDPRR